MSLMRRIINQNNEPVPYNSSKELDQISSILSKYSIEVLDPALKQTKHEDGTVTGIPYVSNSRVRMYGTCPRAFFMKYGEKRESNPTQEIVFGKALHFALEQYNRAKIALAPISFEETLDAFKTNMKEFSEHLYPRELISMPQEAQKILSNYFVLYGDEQPVAAEKEFFLSIDGINLYGVIDLITEDSVIDYKTKSWWKTYPPKASDGDISVQLSFYTLAFYKEYGYWPSHSQLRFLNRKEGDIVNSPHDEFSRRTVGQVEVAIEMLKDFDVLTRMERKLAIPNFSCQYCSYANDCPAMPLNRQVSAL